MTAVRVLAPAALVLLFAAGVLWVYHDTFWWPADEGVYAYVAQRILAGDRLHLDLTDLHGGYGNLLHAFVFQVLGEDLVHLRYPLVVLTGIQALLVVLMLSRHGPVIAALGGLAAVTLSFIQFLNPSANWYALFIAVAAIYVASRSDVTRPRNLLLLGVLLGACFLVRQLSGVILATGLFPWLLLRMSEDSNRSRTLSQVLVAVTGIGILAYLLSKQSATAFVLVGIWPLALLWLCARRVNVGPRRTLATTGWLVLGALLLAAPLVIYHVSQGALVAWLKDILFTALLINSQGFIGDADFAHLPLAAFARIVSPTSWTGAISAAGWLVAVLLLPVTGYLSLRMLRKSTDPSRVHPLPFVAPFWALVAIHYQIPVYLFFAFPVVVAAYLFHARGPVASFLVAFLCVWGLVFHAGQPLDRGWWNTIDGVRFAVDTEADLPRVSLQIPAEDAAHYQAVISYLDGNASADEPLMTIPMHPELNFMLDRKSPVPYYGTPLGLRSPADVDASMRLLRDAAPLFVVHRPGDKYMTPLSQDLLTRVREVSPAPVTRGPFEIYRLPAHGAQHPLPDRE